MNRVSNQTSSNTWSNSSPAEDKADDSANLKPLTLASSEPAVFFAEQEKLAGSKSVIRRLRAGGAIAASSLLAASLLLSACTDDVDDCIVSTPVAASGSSSYNTSYVLPTPNPAQIPVTPGSAQFTSGQATAANQTYCRSRRTGGYYWYTGTRYYGGSTS